MICKNRPANYHQMPNTGRVVISHTLISFSTLHVSQSTRTGGSRAQEHRHIQLTSQACCDEALLTSKISPNTNLGLVSKYLPI